MRAHVHELIDLGGGAFAAPGQVLTDATRPRGGEVAVDFGAAVVAEHVAAGRVSVLQEPAQPARSGKQAGGSAGEEG